MAAPSLVVTCGIAFLAVFVVLAALAAVMRVLIVLLPAPAEAEDGVDPAVVTAITEGVKAAYPGMRVTSIEEAR